MSDYRNHDHILVPNSSQRTPYRIDEADNSHYIRIRQPGPDIIVLVPPGSSASDHRAFLQSSMRSTARSAVADRSADAVLKVLLFIVMPLIFVAATVFLGTDVVGTPPGLEDFEGALGGALIAAVIVYALFLFLPRVGVASALFNTRYPAKPEYLLRQMRDDLGVRYLTERTFAGDQSLVTLRRTVLDRPEEVPEGIWSTLWILAGGEDLYPAAIRKLHRQARDFEDEIVDSRTGPFEAEYRVTLEDFESSRAADNSESNADLTSDPDESGDDSDSRPNTHRA